LAAPVEKERAGSGGRRGMNREIKKKKKEKSTT